MLQNIQKYLEIETILEKSNMQKQLQKTYKGRE